MCKLGEIQLRLAHEYRCFQSKILPVGVRTENRGAGTSLTQSLHESRIQCDGKIAGTGFRGFSYGGNPYRRVSRGIGSKRRGDFRDRKSGHSCSLT